MNIIFRVDGNSILGMGHIMRSISIATAFKKKGCNVIFICADECASKKVNEFGFKAVTLDTDYKNMYEEIPYLEEIFKSVQPKFIIVDSYQATNDYLKNLQSYANTIYIEDIFNSVHPVYAVLNYNISCNKQKYNENYKNTKLFLGTDYIPLREEFQNALPITIKNKVSDIMITTGATDPYNISLNVLEKALNDKNINDINYHIVIGGFYSDKLKEKLYKIKNCHQNIFLYENVKMSELMSDMDIAISAAGSTIYELCTFGIPTVLYAFVDNQLEILKYMSDSSMCCGYYPENNQTLMDNIIKSVNLLVKNVDKRIGIHKSCLKLVDKNGADMFVNELLNGI